VYVEPFLHPWDEADLVMVNDLSDVCVAEFGLLFLFSFEVLCINVNQSNVHYKIGL
jgi:hypothetical protein